MCNIALGQNPNSYRFQFQVSQQLLLGKLLIKWNFYLTIFFIHPQTYLILSSFYNQSMHILPFYVLILSVQNYYGYLPFFIFSWAYVLKIMFPSIYSQNFSSIRLLYSSFQIYLLFVGSNILPISSRTGMTFPFLIIYLGNLFKNQSFDIGLKSFFFIPSSEPTLDYYYFKQSSYFFYIISTAVKNTPLGYFAFRTYGKYPSTKSLKIFRDYLDLQGQKFIPFIAIPSAKNAMGNGYAFLNLCTPFYEQIYVPCPQACNPPFNYQTLLFIVPISIYEGSLQLFFAFAISFFIFYLLSLPYGLFPTHFIPYFFKYYSIYLTFFYNYSFFYFNYLNYWYFWSLFSLIPFKNKFQAFIFYIQAFFYQIYLQVPSTNFQGQYMQPKLVLIYLQLKKLSLRLHVIFVWEEIQLEELVDVILTLTYDLTQMMRVMEEFKLENLCIFYQQRMYQANQEFDLLLFFLLQLEICFNEKLVASLIKVYFLLFQITSIRVFYPSYFQF